MKKVIKFSISYFFCFVGMMLILYALDLEYFDSALKMTVFSLLYSVPALAIHFFVQPRSKTTK